MVKVVKKAIYLTWEDRFKQLKSFKKKYGHCCVEPSSSAPPGLLSFVNNQRRLYASNRLTQTKQEALEKIGFIWKASESMWQNKYKELLAFKKKHGHCSVGWSNDEDKSLAAWISRQKKLIKDNKLSTKQFSMLKKIGCSLEHKDNWHKRVGQLSVFQKKYGHCKVSRNHSDSAGLGKWVQAQRTHYKKGLLSDEKIQILNKLGFVWAIRPDYFIKLDQV